MRAGCTLEVPSSFPGLGRVEQCQSPKPGFLFWPDPKGVTCGQESFLSLPFLPMKCNLVPLEEILPFPASTGTPGRSTEDNSIF